MAKTLTKAWGDYRPGTVLTGDREDLAESPKGAVLVHPTRMEALEQGGYFAPTKVVATEAEKAATPAPATPPAQANAALPASSTPLTKPAPTEPKPAEGKRTDG